VLPTTHVVELSHLLYPGKEQYKLEIRPEKERDEPHGIFYEVELWSHVGTHVEYALHFMPNGREISSLPLWRVVGPAVRVDFRDKGTSEPMTTEEFKARADIRPGDIVLTWTGRDNLYRTPKSHDRPYVTKDAAAWLADDRKIAALGTDSSGFEVRGGPDKDPNHYKFFDREDPIPIFECMANLGELKHDRCFLIALPWLVEGLDSSPVRIIAIEGESEEDNQAAIELLSSLFGLINDQADE
jgi:arylformamidase